MAIQGFKEKALPEDLWRSAYPWQDRPGGSTLWRVSATLQGLSYEKMAHQIALGMRPPSTWRDAEFRGTILGGLQALQVAGVPGFSPGEIGEVATFQTGKRGDAQLLQASRSRSLQEGSEKIRQTVIQQGLERPAWGYRALVVIKPAIGAIAKGKQAVHGAGAAILALTPAAPFAVIPVAVLAKEGVLGEAIAGDIQRWEGYAQGAATRVQVAQERRQILAENARAAAKESQKRGLYVIAGVTGLAVVLLALRN